MNRAYHKTIEKNLYMTIATSDGNKPWISNVYFVCDNNNNFYWYSPKKSKHSQLINTNPQVALCIFDSTAVGDDVNAVYLQAKAIEVTDKEELRHALILYAKKMLKTGFLQGKSLYLQFTKRILDFFGDSPLRLYKAVPTDGWMLAPSKDFNGKFVDGRLKIDVNT